MSQEMKREQPRNAKGEFGSLPPRVPKLPTATATNSAPSKSDDADGLARNNIAQLYARFQAVNGRAPVIGLDIDGTAANMVAGFRGRIAEARGIPLEDAMKHLPEPDEYAMWTGEAAWFGSKQEFLTDFQEAEKAGMYRTLPAYQGIQEVIKTLVEEGFDVKAVTARSADFNQDTAHWLQEQGLPVTEILNPGFDKHTLEDIDIFIDDAPHVVNGLVDNKRKVIIFDQRYNGHQIADSDTHTRRVEGWDINTMTEAIEDLL